MIDIKLIRQNPEKIKKTALDKKIKVDIDKLLELDKQRRELQQKFDEARSQQKKADKEKGAELKQEVKNLEKEQKQVEREYNELLAQVPNVYSDKTPVGPDESGNKVVRKYKEPTKFSFKPKDHMAIGVEQGIIDTEKASKISGSRFNYLFGDAVRLQFAVLQFVFKTLSDQKIIKKLAKQVNNPFDKPFTPVLPPVMVKADIMKKMDRFDPIDDRYYFEKDDLVFTGSAEHSLGPLHMKEIIDEKDLPIRYVGYATSFRREAGSYGKDTKGILRRHHFDKAEIESFIQPEYGQAEQDLIVALQEYMMQQLGLPYQVVEVCTGDMGKPNYRHIDIECWMPGENKYRETHTADYMTDYQSRRLNIKYKNKKGQKELVHMNDATAFAMGRILVGMIENYQKADGTFDIPKVLKKYF